MSTKFINCFKNTKRGSINNFPFDIAMDEKDLKRVNLILFLGVLFDSGLTLNNQVNALSTKITWGVGILTESIHY